MRVTPSQYLALVEIVDEVKTGAISADTDTVVLDILDALGLEDPDWTEGE